MCSPSAKDGSKGKGGTVVEYGPAKALHAIAQRIDFVEIVNRIAPKRNGIPVGELTLLMAINRCLDPRAKWTIPNWYQRTYLPELLGVELPEESGYQTLTRCLDYLTDSVQMEIEMALASRVMERFHLKPDCFLYDVTSTFVEGEGVAGILQFGYSRDHRPDRKQVNYALCVTRKPTVPLFHQAFPGNTVDSKTVKDTMNRFQDGLGLEGCLVIDRGIVTAANIVEIVDERGLDLVGGLRMDRRLRSIAMKASPDSFGKPFGIGKEEIRAREYRLPIGGMPRRCILYFSGEKAARDRKTRERRLAKVEEELGDIASSLRRDGRGRRPTRKGIERRIERLLEDKSCNSLIEWRLVGGRGGRRLKWNRSEEGLREAECLDGKYWLVTTLKASPKEVLEIYRSRDAVERAFRITKETIKIRPIWNRKEEHIKAHLFICFLAYLLLSLLELQVRKKEPAMTAVRTLDELRDMTRRVPRLIDTRRARTLLGYLSDRG